MFTESVLCLPGTIKGPAVNPSWLVNTNLYFASSDNTAEPEISTAAKQVFKTKYFISDFKLGGGGKGGQGRPIREQRECHVREASQQEAGPVRML